MLTIVRCSKQIDDSRLLAIAKTTLRNFPNLNKIFDNFKKFPTVSYQNPNSILGHCASSDPSSLNYLNKIESSLSNLIRNGRLAVAKDGRPPTRFVERITSTLPSQYLPVLPEIHVGDYLLRLFGKEHFFYEEGPKRAKKADFKIILPKKELHLELRTLMKVTTKERIESIFEQVCIEILSIVKKSGGNRNLLFRLDTARLPVDEKHYISIEGSVEYLISQFHKLSLTALVDTEIQIDFHNISRAYFPYDKKQLKASQVLRKENFGELFDYDKNDKNTENHIEQWLDTISVEDLQNCVFDLFQVTNNKDDNCVSISPIDINLEDSNITIPGTSASEMDKESFIAQIHRAIKDKCDSNQRKASEPSILILDTWDWHFNYFEFDSFIALRENILDELRKCKKISGIILFHEITIAGQAFGFHDGRYIENDTCDPNIRVTEKDLQNLSILKAHDDPKVPFKTSNDGRIIVDASLDKIKYLIEIQPTITRCEDKINLLSTIEIFLLNPSIEEKILRSLNEIVIEYCHDSDPRGTQPGVSSNPPDASISCSVPRVRSIAASCIFKILKHVPSHENIQLANSMYEDKNTLVREAAVENLTFLHKIEPSKAITITKKALADNERVRRRLAISFLSYLFGVDKEICLDLCKKLVDIQNSSSIDRDETLQHVLDIVCIGALKYHLLSYSQVLHNLVTNPKLKGKIKEYIASSCSQDEFVVNRSLSGKIIQIYQSLILNSPHGIRAKIGSRLMHSLVKHNLASFPEIKPVLESLAKEQYPEYSHHITIINYLSKFGSSIPVQTAKYLKCVTDVNPHLLTAPLYIQEIFTIIEKLLKILRLQDYRNDLIHILEKMTESDCVNLNLPEAKKLLRKIKDNSSS